MYENPEGLAFGGAQV